MKANLKTKDGTPVKRINISFLISAFHIETAIIGIWVNGLAATKSRINEEIHDMFYSGGDDGWANWISSEHHEDYIKSAKQHAQKLFPTFYKKD